MPRFGCLGTAFPADFADGAIGCERVANFPAGSVRWLRIGSRRFAWSCAAPAGFYQYLLITTGNLLLINGATINKN
jgi:hypothetical protein